LGQKGKVRQRQSKVSDPTQKGGQKRREKEGVHMRPKFLVLGVPRGKEKTGGLNMGRKKTLEGGGIGRNLTGTLVKGKRLLTTEGRVYRQEGKGSEAKQSA